MTIVKDLKPDDIEKNKAIQRKDIWENPKQR